MKTNSLKKVLVEDKSVMNVSCTPSSPHTCYIARIAIRRCRFVQQRKQRVTRWHRNAGTNLQELYESIKFRFLFADTRGEISGD